MEKMLRHGLNETVGWRAFAQGPHRDRLVARLRELDTRVVRALVFDSRGPAPLADWVAFEAFVEAVLASGAVPMLTFSRFAPPYDDPGAVRDFAVRCADIVTRCLDRWGGASVGQWYWCVWNQPNSEWISAGM